MLVGIVPGSSGNATCVVPISVGTGVSLSGADPFVQPEVITTIMNPMIISRLQFLIIYSIAQCPN